MKRTLAVLLASTGFFAACTTTTSMSEMPITSPVGSWVLRAFDLDSGQSVPSPDPSQYTLTLNAELRANVRADCNVCNGNYTTTGTSLEFSLFACTLAACPPDSLEMPYLKALGSTSSYGITSGELRLRYQDGVMRFGPM